MNNSSFQTMYDTIQPSNESTNQQYSKDVPQRKGTRTEQSVHVNEYVMNADMYSNTDNCFTSMLNSPGFACNTTHMFPNQQVDTETMFWRKEQSVGIKPPNEISNQFMTLSENNETNKNIDIRNDFDQFTRIFKSTDSISMSENTRLMNDLPESHNSPQQVYYDMKNSFGQDTRQMIKYNTK